MSEALSDDFRDEPEEILKGDRLYSDDTLRQYLNEISRYPRLSDEQTAELAHAIEVGQLAQERLDTDNQLTREERQELTWLAEAGHEANELMVISNLRLVVSIAKRERSPSLPLLDRIQEGAIGLQEAIERYDYRLGYKLSTYAAFPIEDKIRKARTSQEHNIYVPHSVRSKLALLRRSRDEHMRHHGMEPTVDDLAQAMDTTPEKVIDLFRTEKLATISLDQPLGGDTDTTVGERLADAASDLTVEARALNHEKAARLEQLLAQARLSSREIDVVMARHGLSDKYGHGMPMTYVELAEEMAPVTPQRLKEINDLATYRLQAFVQKSPDLAEAFRELLID